MSEQEKIVKRFYEGVEITLQDYSWKFYVEELGKTYDSYEQATAAIDRFRAEASKVKRKALAFPVVTELGKSFTITGIHAGHGGIVTKPAKSRWGSEDGSHMFPDVPWIREAAAKANELRKEARRIDIALVDFRIGDIRRDDVVAATAELERECDRRRKAAEETDLAKELAKLKPGDAD